MRTQTEMNVFLGAGACVFGCVPERENVFLGEEDTNVGVSHSGLRSPSPRLLHTATSPDQKYMNMILRKYFTKESLRISLRGVKHLRHIGKYFYWSVKMTSYASMT